MRIEIIRFVMTCGKGISFQIDKSFFVNKVNFKQTFLNKDCELARFPYAYFLKKL